MKGVIPLKKISWPTLLIAIVIPMAVGGLSQFLAGDVEAIFATLPKPPLTPPSWVFAVVWPILFTLMGIASYLVYTKSPNWRDHSMALSLYLFQLLFNFSWPILFFRMGQFGLAFLWILVLLVLIALTIKVFYTISKPAAYLMAPYFLWVAFASYLNLAMYLAMKSLPST